MKYGVFLVVSCVVGFLILSHVKEVEGQKDLGCNATNRFPGQCGNNGNILCEADVRAMMLKIPGVPKNIKVACQSCTQMPRNPRFQAPRRMCNCMTDCKK
ncbi:hypothetical protein AALP_AAs49362U000500 [Arabis alpina]|uniref:Uncharacterized protein n=1 Tax=Arabis alpina TaxID=50452 RepID=A0A087FZQ2_ARAAL|nr:hypothetical protein AALP_AAs49362U000500 [Arabis alpina]